MTYRGVVQHGAIVLEDGARLPEGVEVQVTIVAEAPTEQPPIDCRPIGKKLLDFAGKVEGLPADFAMNHDHYLYGTPKP